MNFKPVVSIIICTCNRAEHLRLTLVSLAGIDVPVSTPVELIIVDNASQDHTAQVVQETKISSMCVRYIYEARRGKCYALNTGIAAVMGQVILFTDDDVRLPNAWIEEMSKPILTGKSYAVAGGVKAADHLMRPWMEQLGREWLVSTAYLDPSNPGVMIGANCALSRDILNKIAGFDVELGPGRLGFADDVLFSWHVQMAGYKIDACLHTVVDHHFEENRLTRTNFITGAVKGGQSNAYIAYHVMYANLRFLHLRLAKHCLTLFVMRILKKRDCLALEGMSVWEIKLLKNVAFHKQYMIERKRPRNYEKHGLTKVRGEQYTLPSHFTQA